MKFQTQIPLDKQNNNQIDYNSNVLLLGSCFSENVGKKLNYFKFQNQQNPFGILFHPIAIETLISNAVQKKEYSEKDIIFHNEQWHCFDAHSKLSSSSKKELLINLNKQINTTNEQINKASHIILTLGTSWVYRFIKTNTVVANCHKIPQNQFSKELISVETIVDALNNILSLIKSVNNKAVILFTVSPIRHLKDGFIENMQSKSHLITAIHQVITKQSFYFPSYELMMDELRDYRFYAEDMIHPNQTAIDFIWEKFKYVWIAEDALKTMDKVAEIQKGLQHKPFNLNSEAHQKLLNILEDKKRDIKKRHSHITF